MHRSGAPLDDSFTSITSASSNSTVEDLEEDEEQEHTRENNMGQKNTHEKARGKDGKSKQSKSTKAKESAEDTKNSPKSNTNGESADGKFVEVLNSDAESDKPTGEIDQADDLVKNVLYKYGPLLEDTSSEGMTEKAGKLTSQETSSEDDYDQPEGIEGLSRRSKKEKTLQNWHRILSKVGNELQLENENEKENADNSSGKNHREDNGSSQNEEESDPSHVDDMNRRAVQNWERLVSKLIGGRTKISLRTALTGHVATAEIPPSDDKYESPPGNEDYAGAIENWRRILSKVLEIFVKGRKSDVRELVKEMKKAKSGEEIAFINWKRIIGKVIKKRRRENLANVLKSGLVKNSDNNDSDTKTDEEDIQSAIKNWEKLTLKMIHRNADNDMRQLLEAAIDRNKSSRDDDNVSVSSNDSTDIDDQSFSFKNWKRIILKLTEKNKTADLSRLVKDRKNSKTMPLTTNNETSCDSSLEKETHNKRAIRNWKMLANKLTQESKSNFTNELLKSSLKDKTMAKGDDDSSDTELSTHSAKWERLVSGILKSSRIRDIQAVVVRAKETEDGSSDGESDVSETSNRQESAKTLKAIHNWWALTKKLIEQNAETSLKQIIKERHRKMKDEEKGDSEIRARENWEKMVHKVITNQKVMASLIPKVAERENVPKAKLQSQKSTEDDTSKWVKQNERQLRAMKNWKNLSSKARMITKAEHDRNDDEREDICPSCNNEFLCPILLSCSHTFCRDCVTQFINDSEGQWFKCQTCGAKNMLSDGDEELFCPNFIFLQQMQHKKSGDDGCKYCGKSKLAELVCAQCADKYCKDCAIRHTKQEIFEDHNLIDLQSAENEEKLTKRYYCFKHKKEELNNYCLTCEISICTKCAKKKHKGSKHDCGSVSEAASAGREILEDAVQILEGGIDFESDLANITKMQKGLDVELDEVRTEIKNRVQYLIEKLREREARLYNELERKHEIISDALSRRKDDVELAAHQAENFQTLLRDMQAHENDIEMLQMQATVSERMKDIIQLKQENGLFIDYDFTFHPGVREIESVIDNYGIINVQDRESKRGIIVEGYEESEGNEEESRTEEDILATEGNFDLAEDGNKNNLSEDDGYDQPRETWSPTVQKREDPKVRKPAKPRAKNSSDSDEVKNDHNEPRGKKVQHNTTPAKRASRETLQESPKKQKAKTNPKNSYEEIKPQTYEFEGLRQPSYEGFTQLTSERGEQVNVLKYGVLNYKNESCEVKVKMICPDRSIVSAHVTENADGAFTVFFCPKVTSDFNCFVTMGGKCFKKEYKLLNFYGNFQGMKSKEIDLACRAMSLLRWHITPGLLENKRGKIKRSRKFMRIIGTKK